jgi:CHRD domain
MKKLLLAGFLALVLVVLGVTVAAAGGGNGNGGKHLSGKLDGWQETPSIATPGHGEIKVKVNGSSIRYTLSYDDLRADTLFAHIHLAQEGEPGGVVAFLCGGGGKPDCPARSGSVSGTITADDVQAIDAQGLAAKDIGTVIRALKAEAIYANVHTTEPAGFASGEIRGQIGDDDDDDDHHGNGRGKKHDDDDHDEDDD